MSKKSKISVEDLKSLNLKTGKSVQQVLDDINYHEEQIQSATGMPPRFAKPNYNTNIKGFH